MGVETSVCDCRVYEPFTFKCRGLIAAMNLGDASFYEQGLFRSINFKIMTIMTLNR